MRSVNYQWRQSSLFCVGGTAATFALVAALLAQRNNLSYAYRWLYPRKRLDKSHVPFFMSTVRSGRESSPGYQLCCDAFLANALSVMPNIKDKCQTAKPLPRLHFSQMSAIKSCINISTTLQVSIVETFLTKCAISTSINISYTYLAFCAKTRKAEFVIFFLRCSAGKLFGDFEYHSLIHSVHSEQC